ncbi:helix-turn-helix domain-containing protein [Sphingobium nicotianae]|uniref:Helix-turn-helix transcriptional regulator n=1 Tax=Sphingobium nicotianae TaxID=2782607 RepID=A0A9X1DCS9_9SPHN|nr:helix-turn-helix transcriptional regulator [Sphingobium nicotianae]MBT2187567.1 helix-turn-helix transcriptional regulator [Sphingobium nicotianae]
MSKPETIDRLTERQRACLELVAKGFTSKEIARKLGISHSTVDNHVLAATQLLGVADRREAGRLVAQLGQQLPRQAAGLTDEEKTSIVGVQEELQQQISAGLKLVPPIGGKLNEQTLGHKTIQILSLAFLSTMVVIAMALLISGAFKAFR